MKSRNRNRNIFLNKWETLAAILTIPLVSMLQVYFQFTLKTIGLMLASIMGFGYAIHKLKAPKVRFKEFNTLEGKELYEIREQLRNKTTQRAPKRRDGETPLKRYQAKHLNTPKNLSTFFSNILEKIKAFLHDNFLQKNSPSNHTANHFFPIQIALEKEQEYIPLILNSHNILCCSLKGETFEFTLNASEKMYQYLLYNEKKQKTLNIVGLRYNDADIGAKKLTRMMMDEILQGHTVPDVRVINK